MENVMPKTNHRRGFRENLGHRRCSCPMCGNPRRNGWDNAITMQERRALLDDQPEREWPKAKRTPKRFTIEKRHIDRKGNPGKWWVEFKRYRTKADRDNALTALCKAVQCYGLRYGRYPHRLHEDTYTGPIYEFRAGPDHK